MIDIGYLIIDLQDVKEKRSNNTTPMSLLKDREGYGGSFEIIFALLCAFFTSLSAFDDN